MDDQRRAAKYAKNPKKSSKKTTPNCSKRPKKPKLTVEKHGILALFGLFCANYLCFFTSSFGFFSFYGRFSVVFWLPVFLPLLRWLLPLWLPSTSRLKARGCFSWDRLNGKDGSSIKRPADPLQLQALVLPFHCFAGCCTYGFHPLPG